MCAIEQQFSKCDCNLLRVPKPFQETHEMKFIFIITLRRYFFHYAKIVTDSAKAMMNTTASALA